MLKIEELISMEDIKEVLVSRNDYNPYSRIENRGFWIGLNEEIKNELVNRGEKYLNFEYPLLPATRYMDFKRDGNRTRFQYIYYERRQALGNLVIAECIEDKGRFLDDIINGIWCICEESSWVIHAHNYDYKNGGHKLLPDVNEQIIDLFSAETGALLSHVYYLIQSRLDQISPIICKRIQTEIKNKILTPYLNCNYFSWLGLEHEDAVNNWNPWINSNCMAVALLMEADEKKRVQIIIKAIKSLDSFLKGYHDDGGCDEGPGYWVQAGASLFDCLELLYKATGKKVNLFKEPLVKAIGQYIYRMNIMEENYVNFADCAAKVSIPGELTYRYGQRIEDEKLMALGSATFNQLNDKFNTKSWYAMGRMLNTLINYETLVNDNRSFLYIKDFYFDGIQVVVAREKEDSIQGLYFAAKGGHNAESHNHNDIGHFIVYLDGKPILLDVGVGQYTAKTFSSRRYEIWTMQSQYHNLPTINGIQQKDGVKYKAYNCEYKIDNNEVKFSLDISSAYPKEAGIKNWYRNFVFNKGEVPYIEIKDNFKLDKGSEIIFSFMTLYEPIIDVAGNIKLHYNHEAELNLKYNELLFDVSYEAIEIDKEDDRLIQVWGNKVYRVMLKSKNKMIHNEVEFKILK